MEYWVKYWALVVLRNVAAMIALKIVSMAVGLEMTWGLWICAFVFYVVLGFGDLLTENWKGSR